MATLDEVISGLEERLKERTDKLAAASGLYQLDLQGEGGGVFGLTIQDGTAALTRGPLGNPGVVLTITVADFMALATGKLSGVAAFMAGKLKVKGDMGLALKLQSLLF
ncbi:MAG: SCP2 sterol-binding domain-containing protein [Symbiobacteriia bacterium]